ncbi:MAG: MaoC family dehydratase [Gammaproteobacteria bacterium]|nr:MaoC family dehydratase [Gammaproteobacteria bacterium]
MREGPLRFDQIHIDVARNATDDFNPFHDPGRWRNIHGNPFAGPIALGFQLELLAADRISRLRRDAAETLPASAFSSYDFRFANALRAGEVFYVDVRKTLRDHQGDGGYTNRVVLRKQNGDLVLMGNRHDAACARFLPEWQLGDLPGTKGRQDRALLADNDWFLKRKYLNTSNGKNFAVGALCQQSDYFDEICDKVHFPALFTASLISCALLERGRHANYDFEADPMVYLSHQISIDNQVQDSLRSNDCLDILVEGPSITTDTRGLTAGHGEQMTYRCFGIARESELLFRAVVKLAPLHAMTASPVT